MSFFQKITDFFEYLFNRNSPEVQKKIQAKKIESEINQFRPELYKDGELIGNFAEAIRLLYINTSPINEILSATIASPDFARNNRFEAQLVLSGYTSQSQEIITSLSYERRKQEIEESSNFTNSQIFEKQFKRLEKVLHELNADVFKKIDKDLNGIYQLADLCKFNFVTMLQIFDSNFIALDHKYKPTYKSAPLSKLLNFLEDFYYQIYGLTINTSTVNAIKALANLKYNGSVPDEWFKGLVENLKKISSIIKNILSPEKIKLLISLAKNDPLYKPAVAQYNNQASKKFAEMMRAKFRSDEQRIKTELKDDKVRKNLDKLFENTFLMTLNGYNYQTNEKLQKESSFTFTYITPMQVLKTFVNTYLSEGIRALLNDIVVEGFFNNPAYKTEFSNCVFSSLEIADNIKEFEDSFNSGQRNDLSTLDSHLKNGHKDQEFMKKLEMMVNSINLEASKIITKETNTLNALFKIIQLMIQDSKKPTSETISNLKVLMMSSRNRDNTDLLEKQHANWEIFFEIMKNYAIITNAK